MSCPQKGEAGKDEDPSIKKLKGKSERQAKANMGKKKVKIKAGQGGGKMLEEKSPPLKRKDKK